MTIVLNPSIPQPATPARPISRSVQGFRKPRNIYEDQAQMIRQTGSKQYSLMSWSLPIAAILTLAFYLLLGLPLFKGGLIARYTSGHPIEYATVAMFFWAVADLTLRGWRLRRERAALTHAWLPDQPSLVSPDHASEWLRRLADAPRAIRHTFLGLRLRGALESVRQKRAADHLDDYLRYLADLEADRAHGSFSLVRIIAWMIPILGFLGTVVGITDAIANLSPAQLENSLSSVTGGLAIAFDTTALSLTLSMLVMFQMFVIERGYQGVLAEVERRAQAELSHRFEIGDAAAAAFVGVLRTTSETLLERVAQLTHRQAEIWGQSVTAWLQQAAVDRQQQTERWQQLLTGMDQHWRQHVHAVHSTSQQLETVRQGLEQVAELLTRLFTAGHSLREMQASLDENLKRLVQTEKMDEAIHLLSGAIHLLMARPVREIEASAKAA